MRYFMRLIAIVLAVLAWPAVAIRDAVRHAWPPLDARDVLALDSAAHALDTGQTRRVRVAAFIKRLLTHDLYVAGHFDPGRLLA